MFSRMHYLPALVACTMIVFAAGRAPERICNPNQSTGEAPSNANCCCPSGCSCCKGVAQSQEISSEKQGSCELSCCNTEREATRVLAPQISSSDSSKASHRSSCPCCPSGPGSGNCCYCVAKTTDCLQMNLAPSFPTPYDIGFVVEPSLHVPDAFPDQLFQPPRSC